MFPEKPLTDEAYKLIQYKQLRKTELCENLGIRLIHILDLDWFSYKQDIIKSILAMSLGVYSKKIYARKCVFKEVIDKKLVKEFLNTNHIQGYTGFSKAYGLYYGDELVQLITYQLNSNHSNNDIELNRMAPKKYYRIIGGFSKLVSDSMKMLNINRITSYIDRGIFDGNGYYSTGFIKLYCTKPAYMYVFKNELKRREFGMRKNIEKMYNKKLISV